MRSATYVIAYAPRLLNGGVTTRFSQSPTQIRRFLSAGPNCTLIHFVVRFCHQCQRQPCPNPNPERREKISERRCNEELVREPSTVSSKLGEVGNTTGTGTLIPFRTVFVPVSEATRTVTPTALEIYRKMKMSRGVSVDFQPCCRT